LTPVKRKPGRPRKHPLPAQARTEYQGVSLVALTDEIKDIPINDIHCWNVSTVRDAVVGHMLGQFNSSAMLVDAMLADDRVQGATNGRIKGVTKNDIVYEPSKLVANEALARTVAETCQELHSEIFPESCLEDILKWTIHLGWSLDELVWSVRRDMWIPRLKSWHPAYSYYLLTDRRYVALSQSGSIEIKPNDPKWALYTPYGSYRGWIRGAVRSISIPWLVRQFALRDWARYSEVHGLPQKKAKVPAQAPAEDKRRFFTAIKSLGSNASFMLPVPIGGGEWDIELLEAKDTAWKGFQGLIEQCDKSITLTVRGTNLTTEVQTGTGAATEAHRSEDADYAKSDCLKLAEFMKTQVLRWFCLYNFGDADLAPTPVFQLDTSDKKAESETLKTIVATMTELKTLGNQYNITSIAERFGIPLNPDFDPEAEQAPSVVLAPTDVAKVVKVNEARRSSGLKDLTTPDGKPDPDGELTVSAFDEKQKPKKAPFDAQPE
jgi:phage gp29-like protein